MSNPLNIKDVLAQAIAQGASDVHITRDSPPVVRVDGQLRHLDYPVLDAGDTREVAKTVLREKEMDDLSCRGEVDLSYRVPGEGFFRVNAYRQGGSISLAFRIINRVVPTVDSLRLPGIVKTLSGYPRGLIVVTGPAGCGKSTTLAAMVNLINEERFSHIITLEDPIEYVHTQKKSIINQREIGRDSKSFPLALRAALRQDPDVILVGEMRDWESISIALTAAETGHLVLTSLHTMDAPKTIDRIIDAFSPSQQEQVRVQLATSLVGVISQRLLACKGKGGRIPAVEVLINTHAVKNLIREKKVHQIYSFMEAGAKYGMQTMDSHLLTLVGDGAISTASALENARDRDAMKDAIRQHQNG